MKRLSVWLMLVAACAPDRAAPRATTVDSVPAATAIATSPRFEDYPATALAGPPAPVDLSSVAWAQTFRTTLVAGAARGPNFAGEFTIITWRCGTQCRSSAIVSARTGQVFDDSPLDFSCHQPEYELSSTLVIEPSLSTDVGPCSAGPSRFLRWTGDSFVVLQQ